jgi:hypothetical protein
MNNAHFYEMKLYATKVTSAKPIKETSINQPNPQTSEEDTINNFKFQEEPSFVKEFRDFASQANERPLTTVFMGVVSGGEERLMPYEQIAEMSSMTPYIEVNIDTGFNMQRVLEMNYAMYIQERALVRRKITIEIILSICVCLFLLVTYLAY